MRKITINGPEVERSDGTIRCIGYGTDSQGRVTGRFALPNEWEWSAPDETENIEYVDSMDELPPKNDRYRLDVS